MSVSSMISVIVSSVRLVAVFSCQNFHRSFTSFLKFGNMCAVLKANEGMFSSAKRTSRETLMDSKYRITKDFLQNSERLFVGWLLLCCWLRTIRGIPFFVTSLKPSLCFSTTFKQFYSALYVMRSFDCVQCYRLESIYNGG